MLFGYHWKLWHIQGIHHEIYGTVAVCNCNGFKNTKLKFSKFSFNQCSILFVIINFDISDCRCLSAAPQTQKRAENRPVADDKKPNMSFLTNIFRGEVQPAQVFPYPEVLDAEQKEYIAAFVDPVTRFFEVGSVWVLSSNLTF